MYSTASNKVYGIIYLVVRCEVLYVSTTKNGDNNQQKELHPSQRTTPPPTVEVLDFKVFNSTKFKHLAREIADEPAETLGASPDLIPLDTHEIFFALY